MIKVVVLTIKNTMKKLAYVNIMNLICKLRSYLFHFSTKTQAVRLEKRHRLVLFSPTAFTTPQLASK